MKLTSNDRASWIHTIWTAIEEWEEAHEGRNAAGGETLVSANEDRYDDICMAMAWIAEELGVEQ